MKDNKNFWRVVDYIRLHFLAYEYMVGTKEMLRKSRYLMKEYRRRKSYWGDTEEVYNDFIREYVRPYIKNQMEASQNGQEINVCSAEKYVSNGDQQVVSIRSGKHAQAVQRETHLS